MENEATTKTPIQTASGIRLLSSAQPAYPALPAACALVPCALPPFVPSCLSGYESIMQNEPNSRGAKTNATPFVTRNYENKPPLATRRKRTQSNPNEPNLSKRNKMPLNLCPEKHYGKFFSPSYPAERTQSNPIGAESHYHNAVAGICQAVEEDRRQKCSGANEQPAENQARQECQG